MKDRQRTFRVEGVVLRHLDWGEADRLVMLFARDRGKLQALAKGVRKARSRKAGHLEPFNRVSLLLARGRDLPLITQAETLTSYPVFHEDLLRMGYGAYVLELIDRFAVEGEANVALYQLLVETLERLGCSSEPFFELRYFEVKLLDQVGFRPEFFRCVVCNESIQPRDQFFSCELGGAVCPNCAVGQRALRPVSMQALKYLRHFQRSSYVEARRAKIPLPILEEMESLLGLYVQTLLERNLNTLQFIRSISQLSRLQVTPPTKDS
ncbi:MAG: DNA repair protein RecO [Anaerolineales bacterium]|nr:DNA repair protein RecO [Anaerolineales bacterium]MCS7247386.1 DNA repair protein RecO [Anaerolineales bacterium]MDW8161197.1 DNA repair protein RecO [Anaerolineales bacterium]MDW8446276.1 DNA repair protein RecO [Anaerolineales bacterium]